MEVSASIKQPNPGSGLGYWPAFWMLGAGFGASGAGTSGTMTCSNWPQVGEVDIMEDVNALSDVAGTLHCGVGPGRAVQRDHRPGQRSRGLLRMPDRVQHLLGHREPDQHQQRVDHLVPQRNRLPYGHREPDRHVGLAGRSGPRVLPHPGRRHRRRLPERRLQLLDAGQRDQFGCGHERRLRRGLHHLRQRQRRRRRGGGGGGGGKSCTTTATSDISADCFSASQGTINVTSTTDADPVGVDSNQAAQLTNGEYLKYSGVNFGTGSTQFDARVASGAAGGVSGLVEVVLDNPANAPVGSFAVANTGGWSSWRTVPANISSVTGTHDVYLEFSSGAGGSPPFVSLHWFNFPAH